MFITKKRIEHADKKLGVYQRSGQKPTFNYNKKFGTNMTHDSVIFDIILNASDQAKEAVLSVEAYNDMYDDLGLIKRAKQDQIENGFNTYGPLITYVLNMTERKFGPQSVQRNTSYSCRCFDNKPEIIDYARMVCKITLDRFEFKAKQKLSLVA